MGKIRESRNRTLREIVFPVLLSVSLAGLSWVHPLPVGAQRGIDPALGLDSLRNAEYLSLHTKSGGAYLADGSYRERTVPGTASDVIVNLTRYVAYGQLDDREAAAVVTVTQTGGTGVFYDLAVVVNRSGKAFNVAVMNLGDRVRIQSLAIADDEIVVEMMGHGPGDPMCCPTRSVVARYALVGTALIRKMMTTPEQADTVDSLMGVAWKWREMRLADGSVTKIDQPDLYTLRFISDTGFIVRADCNRGGGTYSQENNQLRMKVNRITRAACPPGSLSDEYLRCLEEAYGFRTEEGLLYVLVRGDAGVMAFARE
jgi:heat shock protein HslJ